MNTKLFKIYIGMAAILLTIGACSFDFIPTRGSGDLVSETRQVSGFTAVEFSGAGDVEIIQDGSESIIIETDDDVMEYVTSEVRGGTLFVGLDFDGRVSILPTKMRVTLHVIDLNTISTSGAWDIQAESFETDSLNATISGAGSLQIDSLSANTLEAEISGAGEFTLAGQVEEQHVAISGTGTYKAGDLESQSAVVEISGAGNATLWVIETLEVSISGTGHVDYYGSPQVNLDQSGVGEVNNLGEK